MYKVNCREANMCIFCQYWLGESPNLDYFSGKCKVKTVKGKCSLDEAEQYHSATDLCHCFRKRIVYL